MRWRQLACLLPLLLPLAACTVVQVQSTARAPRLSFWPLGVRIDAARGSTLSVSGSSIGLGGGCYSAALGFARFQCTFIPPRTCGVAVIVNPSKGLIAQWIEIAKQLQQAPRVRCLTGEQR